MFLPGRQLSQDAERIRNTLSWRPEAQEELGNLEHQPRDTATLVVVSDSVAVQLVWLFYRFDGRHYVVASTKEIRVGP